MLDNKVDENKHLSSGSADDTVFTASPPLATQLQKVLNMFELPQVGSSKGASATTAAASRANMNVNPRSASKRETLGAPSASAAAPTRDGPVRKTKHDAHIDHLINAHQAKVDQQAGYDARARASVPCSPKRALGEARQHASVQQLRQAEQRIAGAQRQKEEREHERELQREHTDIDIAKGAEHPEWEGFYDNENFVGHRSGQQESAAQRSRGVVEVDSRSPRLNQAVRGMVQSARGVAQSVTGIGELVTGACLPTEEKD